jgi:Ca2+-binding EF-hand superfamily protein
MIQERYGVKKDKDDNKHLTLAELGMDKATFARLDRNGDGVLDAEELAGFVDRPADLELVLRLGTRKDTEKSIDTVAAKDHPLAEKFKVQHSFGHIDMGKARLHMLTSDASAMPDRFSGLAREQYLVQFRQVDKDNKGFIDAEQAKGNRTMRNLFKAAEREGDGKLTEKKLTAYLERLQELQNRATAACVTLEFSDQNRGLFDLLDTDRDGRLSVREMRNAVKLLEQLDREGKGHITKADIPRMYTMTIRQGAAAGTTNPQAAFFALYGGSYDSNAERPGRGPVWFQKMDRNRDGDVSRKEWLWSEDLFRKIDTDGDGLISVEEAEAYDRLMRKEGKGKP